MSGTGTTSRRLRCAIYTRKSTEEGLDQDFNSLDAQHEACAAYITSQASLGWKLVPDRYDDGGISGGTMDRPALQRLLADIREHRVDVVVVYKIDRLTRSLSDFARIVETFDQAQASFVSVTQQFNTTTSMGRLTLNVLLSFAQFEREVTAERIRDKIAASKKKGMWMGGTVPLGYRVHNRKLIVHDDEAEIVRFLFRRYLQLRSVRAVADEANAQGWRTKDTPTDKAANRLADVSQGSASDTKVRRRVFGRGQVAYILANPLYVGKTRHRDRIHDGAHEAIIDEETFNRAKEFLHGAAPARQSAANVSDGHLLKGLVFDEHGCVLRSSHAKTRGRRYLYYVSKDAIEQRGKGRDGWRLPALILDELVEARLERLLEDGPNLATALEAILEPAAVAAALGQARPFWSAYRRTSTRDRQRTVSSLITRVDLRTGSLAISIDIVALAKALGSPSARKDANATSKTIRLDCPISLRRRGNETRLVLKDGSEASRHLDQGLVARLVEAHRFLAQLTDGSGQSLTDIANVHGVDRSDLARSLRLAFLSPRVTDAILSGVQPPELTTHLLTRLADLPHDWSRQEKQLL